MKIAAAVLGLLLAPAISEACSFTFFVEPWPRQNYFPDAAAINSPIPRLNVSSSVKYRGDIPVSELDDVGCNIYAAFEVRLRIDPKTKGRLEDYGYLFKAKSNGSRRTTIPTIPLRAKVEGDEAVFEFSVMDSGSVRLQPIDIDVVAVAVDRRWREGQPTRFRLHAAD